MVRNLYQCTAADLATKQVETVPGGRSVEAAYEWLADKGYDVAPVVEDDQPVGYLSIDNRPDQSDSASVSGHTQAITLEKIISTDAKFGSVLAALYDRSFYFLGGRNRVTGILTRADLNTSPAYIHLYDRLTLLEEGFRELITVHAPDWIENEEIDLYADERDAIEQRYQRAQSANIALAKVHYAQFSTLVKVISAVEPCWTACDFASEDAAERALSDVTDVRNAVAHSNLLIENTGQGLMEGRTVGTLLDVYETIQACIDALDAGAG